jgi:hypothetical protein
VTDNFGATAEDTHVINIGGNASPTASFSTSPANPLTLTDVTFTSTSTDSDGVIATVAWDLDADGNSESAGTPITKRFATPGLYVVRLKVTDDDGASHVAQKTIDVVNRAPTVVIAIDPGSPLSLEPVTLTANATDPDGTITAIQWDLDDDGAFDDGSGATITHSFPAKGTYTVRVRVTDGGGSSSTGTRTVGVTNRLPQATFAHDPASPVQRQEVTMTSTSIDLDGTIAKLEWDTDNDGAFDDGTGTRVTRAFQAPGNMTVRLRVTDNDGGQAIGWQTIEIANAPPETSIIAGVSGPTTDSTPEFRFLADEADVHFMCRFDDEPFASCTSPFSPDAPLADGDHIFEVAARDAEGAIDATPSKAEFTVATLKPASSALAPGTSRDSTIGIDYERSDGSGPPVAEVELWVNTPGSATFQLESVDPTPATPRFTYEANAGDGAYRFYTRARNQAGAYEAAPQSPDAVTTLDTVSPTSAATAPAVSTARSLTVNYSAADRGAGVEAVELWTLVPGATRYELSSVDRTPETPSFDFTADAGGLYRFYTRARDLAGNLEDVPQNPPDASTSVALASAPGDVVSPSPPPSARSTASSVGLVSRSLRLRRRAVTVTLVCAGEAPCNGSIELRTTRSTSAAKRRAMKLAKAKITISPGAASKLKLTLSRAGMRRIARLRKLKVVVAIDLLAGIDATHAVSLRR